MIRCREGDFTYTRDEIQLMQHEIASLKDAGSDGFVIGAVNDVGGVDTTAVQRLVECTKGLPVTFHRAFDSMKNHEEAMEVLIQLGVQRVLTSGGESNVEAGITNLKKWNESYSSKIIILPGGGVTSKNISSLREHTGCTEFHSSAKGITTPTPFGSNIEPDPEELKLLLHAIR
jgi:copper homeostasis protein